MSKRILAEELDDKSMTNPKNVLTVGLAAATPALVLPFLAGWFLSLQPGFAQLNSCATTWDSNLCLLVS
jgi:hypothetical protein